MHTLFLRKNGETKISSSMDEKMLISDARAYLADKPELADNADCVIRRDLDNKIIQIIQSATVYEGRGISIKLVE